MSVGERNPVAIVEDRWRGRRRVFTRRAYRSSIYERPQRQRTRQRQDAATLYDLPEGVEVTYWTFCALWLCSFHFESFHIRTAVIARAPSAGCDPITLSVAPL